MGRSGAVSLGIIGALLFSCAGGDDDDAPPPPPKVTSMVFEAEDPCSARVPEPTDLFRTEEGTSERAACDGPMDPVERALYLAQIDEGVPLNANIVLPIEGSLDGASLTSTVPFSLSGPSAGGALPPLVMLRAAGTTTNAADFEVLSFSASYDDAIRISPEIALLPGHQYVVVATNAIKDDERPQKPVVAAPETELLVGDTPIEAGAIEGLGVEAAARLERMRQRLAPIVSILAGAAPPIPAEAIISIQSFTTIPAPLDRTMGIFDAYKAAVDQGRYGFSVTTVGGDIDPAELYPGLPPAAYASILAFRRGTITVPQVLGEDLRQRDGFPAVVREIEVPFLMSIPRNAATYSVVLYTSGYGRSKLDARSLANEFAATPEAAVLAIDLRCHGDRSPDGSGVCAEGRTQSEVAALADDAPNNGNPELVGADGIPDASGQYFFPGDAQALRDTQIAAAIEILHVYLTLRDGTAFVAEGINPNSNDIHLIAHGHSALAASMAVAFAEVAPRTVQLPAGGVGFEELIFSGPEELQASFEATLPDGIGADRALEYVQRMEAAFLRSVDLDIFGERVAEQLDAGGQARRILLNHGSSDTAVPAAARDRLIDAVPIPSNRVSRHPPACDDFYIFSCRLGIDDPTAPRQQIVSFMDSNGVTVLPP